MSPRTSDEWAEIVRLVRAYALRKYGWQARAITIHSPYPGVEHLEPFPAVTPPAPRLRVLEWASGEEPKHLSDFRTVYWPGLGQFTFSTTQAGVIKQLWEAMVDGTWEVSQRTLLSRAGSQSDRLVDLFKGHPAWRALILPGAVAGNYRFPPMPAGEDEPTTTQESGE